MTRGSHIHGYTLLEMLVVLAIIGILSTIVAINFSKLEQNINGSVNIVTSALTSGRTQAISTTSAVRVNLVSGVLSFSSASLCSATSGWTALPLLKPSLPSDITLSSATLTRDPVSNLNTLLTCFTARGSTALPSTLLLTDTKNHTASVTIYVTGSVQ